MTQHDLQIDLGILTHTTKYTAKTRIYPMHNYSVLYIATLVHKNLIKSDRKTIILHIYISHSVIHMRFTNQVRKFDWLIQSQRALVSINLDEYITKIMHAICVYYTVH